MSITIPAGIVPLRSLTTNEILYGDRVTSYRWEVLTHAAGVDTLKGYLDGVIEPSASLDWALYSAVKGSGSLKVADLAAAQPGFLRIGQVALAAARLRPVLVVDGLPEIPLGVYLFTAAPEKWSSSGRVYELALLDKCTVLDQDEIDATYTVAAGTVILQAVATVIASAGETITVDATQTATLGATMVWPTGTTKLQIVNDLLSALNYNALWVDGVGNFRTTPYVVPASRSIKYEALAGIDRELVDGDLSIYADEWDRDRDQFKVPNKITALQSGNGDVAPLTGVATNTDPSSPFSYSSRGNRWISRTITVEVPTGTTAEINAFLQAKARASLIAASSVQAAVELKHLPLPVRVSDVLRFANGPAGIDKRHVLTHISLDAHPLGLMKSTLQEVIDL